MKRTFIFAANASTRPDTSEVGVPMNQRNPFVSNIMSNIRHTKTKATKNLNAFIFFSPIAVPVQGQLQRCRMYIEAKDNLGVREESDKRSKFMGVSPKWSISNNKRTQHDQVQ